MLTVGGERSVHLWGRHQQQVKCVEIQAFEGVEIPAAGRKVGRGGGGSVTLLGDASQNLEQVRPRPQPATALESPSTCAGAWGRGCGAERSQSRFP